MKNALPKKSWRNGTARYAQTFREFTMAHAASPCHGPKSAVGSRVFRAFDLSALEFHSASAPPSPQTSSLPVPADGATREKQIPPKTDPSSEPEPPPLQMTPTSRARKIGIGFCLLTSVPVSGQSTELLPEILVLAERWTDQESAAPLAGWSRGDLQDAAPRTIDEMLAREPSFSLYRRQS